MHPIIHELDQRVNTYLEAMRGIPVWNGEEHSKEEIKFMEFLDNIEKEVDMKPEAFILYQWYHDTITRFGQEQVAPKCHVIPNMLTQLMKRLNFAKLYPLSESIDPNSFGTILTTFANHLIYRFDPSTSITNLMGLLGLVHPGCQAIVAGFAQEINHRLATTLNLIADLEKAPAIYTDRNVMSNAVQQSLPFLHFTITPYLFPEVPSNLTIIRHEDLQQSIDNCFGVLFDSIAIYATIAATTMVHEQLSGFFTDLHSSCFSIISTPIKELDTKLWPQFRVFVPKIGKYSWHTCLWQCYPIIMSSVHSLTGNTDNDAFKEIMGSLLNQIIQLLPEKLEDDAFADHFQPITSLFCSSYHWAKYPADFMNTFFSFCIQFLTNLQCLNSPFYSDFMQFVTKALSPSSQFPHAAAFVGQMDRSQLIIPAFTIALYGSIFTDEEMVYRSGGTLTARRQLAQKIVGWLGEQNNLAEIFDCCIKVNPPTDELTADAYMFLAPLCLNIQTQTEFFSNFPVSGSAWFIVTREFFKARLPDYSFNPDFLQYMFNFVDSPAAANEEIPQMVIQAFFVRYAIEYISRFPDIVSPVIGSFKFDPTPFVKINLAEPAHINAVLMLLCAQRNTDIFVEAVSSTVTSLTKGQAKLDRARGIIFNWLPVCGLLALGLAIIPEIDHPSALREFDESMLALLRKIDKKNDDKCLYLERAFFTYVANHIATSPLGEEYLKAIVDHGYCNYFSELVLCYIGYISRSTGQLGLASKCLQIIQESFIALVSDCGSIPEFQGAIGNCLTQIAQSHASYGIFNDASFFSSLREALLSELSDECEAGEIFQFAIDQITAIEQQYSNPA